ncbi:two-component system sensor histidine kinase MtrB [soil metagenome]
MRQFDWRGLVRGAASIWRTSLQVRTVAITVVLSALAVTAIGGFMSYSVGNNLFNSRVQQLLRVSQLANDAAQDRFTQAGESATPDLEGAMKAAIQAAAATAGAGSTSIAILRTPGQDGPNLPTDLTTGGFQGTMVSQSLRDRVAAPVKTPRTRYQSIALDTAGSRHPGLSVGSVLDVPNSGQYELYLVYDLNDTQQTLDLVQNTLLVGGAALVVLIGAVTIIVVRLVVGPVRMAAQTSERLAAGELDIRIPVKGDDVIATLARSFNGMASSMQQQITRLATLSQVQQRFVSDVSHELRTPLTTIRLAGDVLYDNRDEFDPTTARTAELLHTQVQRFELLLADLLEMSRYDAGAVDMDPEPTNLVRLSEDAMDSVRSLSDSKGSELRLVAPGGYFEAEVDPRRIRRILLNLLGNAIDHGEGNPIDVYVDSNQTAVAIAVRDYGVGMTTAAMERVFDRFWRADPSRQRVTGGTGLGLAISLEDAALHGGWLEVWSAPGEGSCFRLTIPRVQGMELTSSPIDLPPADAIGDES